MSETRVVNLRAEEFDVYIGRRNETYVTYFEALFGNPFRVEDYGREGAIARYREYLWRRAAGDDTFRARLFALRGKILGCYCKPLPCHGDVIVEWLNTHGTTPNTEPSK